MPTVLRSAARCASVGLRYDVANGRTLKLDGGTLVVRYGGTGPLVVCTHAFGPTAWGPLERLRRTHTVAIPLWQTATLDFETSVTLTWFAPLLDMLGHDKAALCAWSMAGPSAIAHAADAPARLSHLILVDIAGMSDEMPSLRLRDVPHAILSSLLGRPTRGFVRALCRGWVHRRDFDRRALEAAAYDFFRTTPNALGAPGEDDDDEEDDDLSSLVDAFADIAAPTLVLAGRHSTVLGPEQAEAVVAALPNGELRVFENSGHSLQLEEPEAFEDALLAFLKECREPCR